ncbi:hypothetical protein C8R43DRAFT_1000801 [Mycena crocata]|nr:hypothetical protein C8R43DRAFT_1000801 [Mycena crocata]
MYMTRHFISAVQLLTPTSLAALSPSTLPAMFSLTKCFMTLVLVSTSALSLTINAPSSPQSGSTTTITFTSTPTDPTFSIELFHPSFNEAIAIANNVDPSTGQITVALPIVPAGDQYTLEAVNITNINQVFATSADFNIAAAPSPSMTLSSASATAPASIPVGGSSASASGIPSGVIPSGVSGANTGSASIPSAHRVLSQWASRALHTPAIQIDIA